MGETGLFEDVETEDVPWSAAGLWHRSSHRTHCPSHSWYCGVDGQWSYPRNSESTLVSPPFFLGLDPRLPFWVWYDVALYGMTGLFVELGDSDAWEKLDFVGSGGALDPLLVGLDWTEYTYDLSRHPPGTEVRLRFRFVSDDEPTFEGVYVDDITVHSAAPESVFSETFLAWFKTG